MESDFQNSIPEEDDFIPDWLNESSSEAEYLSILNSEQKAAVVHDGKALLILAGAGSGKTRVITTKIAYLIGQKNVDPFSILAVTFTKKAANEMRERAVRLEERAQYAQIRTFHSFGAYFLRTHAEEAGVDKNFTVYDDDDMVTLISKACPALTRQQASKAAHKISLAKDYCLTPESEGLSTIESDSNFPEIYAAYEKRLRATGNVDFGDLIMLPYLVIRDNPLIKLEMQQRYKVIMVDEYQDSNVAQFLLLRAISGVEDGSSTYVCVVGDDDQSIYKFRGAEVQNILNFQKHFPGTDLIRLETNYRSSQQILDCADSVVKNNSSRLGKTLVSARGKGKLPALVFLPTQDDETQFCADMIEQSHAAGVPYSDWAILYRTNAQSLGFETEFLHRKLPYTVVGSLKFYEREEIKDALSWISFVANPRDEIAFRRIVNKPARGIGGTTQDKIVEASAGESIVDGCDKVKLSKKALEGISFFKSLVEEFSKMVPELEPEEELAVNESRQKMAGDALEENVEEVVKRIELNKKNSGLKIEKLSSFVETVIKKSGLEEFHKSQDEVAGTQKVSNLQELVNSAVLYPCTKAGLMEFLDHIELDRTLETQESDDDDGDKVTLITLHNTKGLEFPRVIITGMETGIFPREDKFGEELEEERRLFYVGITRAQDELYLTCCGLRRIYGQTRGMMPSHFLSEIGEKQMRILGKKPMGFKLGHPDGAGVVSGGNSGNRDYALEKKWYVGLSVYHDDYGYGQIVHKEYSEGEYVVSVSFDTGGIKKFLPKYQAKSLIIQEDYDE